MTFTDATQEVAGTSSRTPRAGPRRTTRSSCSPPTRRTGRRRSRRIRTVRPGTDGKFTDRQPAAGRLSHRGARRHRAGRGERPGVPGATGRRRPYRILAGRRREERCRTCGSRGAYNPDLRARTRRSSRARDHPISRRDIDPDALRVLYRLQQQRSRRLPRRRQRPRPAPRPPAEGLRHRHGRAPVPDQAAVPELLDHRPPVPARAHQVRARRRSRSRRSGRSFPTTRPASPRPRPDRRRSVARRLRRTGHGRARVDAGASRSRDATPGQIGIVHRDNTFGTPEEDAFRRDFTINGLFYDIATRSVIDYVGGLDDLERRVIRSIGDPRVRFVEDPVRMLRAAVFARAARLRHGRARRRSDRRASRADPRRRRRRGCSRSTSRFCDRDTAEASFRALGRVRLLELMTPELKSPGDAVWDALARLDRYRQQFPSAPPELTNVVLVGALLVPIGLLQRRIPEAGHDPRGDRLAFGMLPSLSQRSRAAAPARPDAAAAHRPEPAARESRAGCRAGRPSPTRSPGSTSSATRPTWSRTGNRCAIIGRRPPRQTTPPITPATPHTMPRPASAPDGVAADAAAADGARRGTGTGGTPVRRVR